MPGEPETHASRISWIDNAKGLAICLVVFAHVLGGVLARGWVDPTGAWRGVYDFIYLFHMPLFFMVAGFFCVDAMRRSPSHAFLTALGSIAWPYLLWEVLIRAAVTPVIQTVTIAHDIPSWAGQTYNARVWLAKAATGEGAWFLWTLFFMQLGLIPVARAPRWLVFAASLVVFAFADRAWLGPFETVAIYLPYLALGALLQPVLPRLEIEGNLRQLVASLALFGLLGTALALGWTNSKFVRMLCGCAGSLALVALVQCIRGARARAWLNRLGVASLAIYLLHPYFQGGARTLLLSLGGTDVALQLTLVTLAAIAGPYAVFTSTKRFGAPWLFRLRLASSRHSAPSVSSPVAASE